MESILVSVKKLLGIVERDSHYDPDIIMLINSAFSTLNQLGIGPAEGFMIVDDEAEWDDVFSHQTATAKQFTGDEARLLLQCIRQYVFQKVRLAFDPPSTSFHLEAINKQISELEWRMSVIVDPSSDAERGGCVQNGSKLFDVYSERRRRFSGASRR